MGLKDIARTIELDNYRIIQHQTWGHLFPNKKEVFIGSIRIALTDYSDLIVLKDSSNVPSSPWWFSSLTDYANDFLTEKNNPGVVYEIQIHCKVIVNKDKTRHIKISNMGEKIVLE